MTESELLNGVNIGLNEPPQDDHEDFQITRDEFDQLQRALKNEKFRSMLNEYAEEVQDPKSRKLYQTEMKELERQKGNVIHFINPIAGFVLKTSVNGDKKAFINVCSNPMIRKLSFESAVQDDKSGVICSIPYAQSPKREDLDKAGRYCEVYDVVFNPNTVALCGSNEQVRQQVETVALEAVESSFGVKLDKNNVKKPKLKYKGLKHATVIKYKIGEDPPTVLDARQLKHEAPPQPQEAYLTRKPKNDKKASRKENKPVAKEEAKPKPSSTDSENVDWTEPKYNFKYRSHVDLQDFCNDNLREGRSKKPVPEEIILTVDLPLIPDASYLDADVLEGGWDFELTASRKANYRLKLKLPFQVHCDRSKASFDVDKRKLVIIMRTVQKPVMNVLQTFAQNPSFEEPMSADETAHSNAEDEPDHGNHKKRAEDETKVRFEHSDSTSSEENELNKDKQIVPEFINGDVVVKSILKRSARSRSMSESWLDDRSSSVEEEFMSLENLNEDDESNPDEHHNHEKSVRFKEGVQEQLFRSNSSILGQRKKNQRKSKNKRKARGRLNSEGSVSSMDEEDVSGPDSRMGIFRKGGTDTYKNECDNLKDLTGEE